MTRLMILVAAVLAASLLLSVPSMAAALKVRVEGLRDGKGVVRFSLYHRPKDFPEKSKGLTLTVPAHKGEVTAEFTGLAPGRYALAFFHDEDDDDHFDRGFLGLPLEGFGFSNDAVVFLGPPSFDAAAVTVGADGTTITVRMRY